MFTSPFMGLTIWNLATDLYDHNAQATNLSAIDAHNHSSGQGQQIPTGGIANGAITGAKIATGAVDIINITGALAQQSGVNVTGATASGATINVGPGSRTNTAYGFLGDAADQVQNVVLPTQGLILVSYQATWQESVAGAARAALFLNSNQLKAGFASGSGPGTQAAATTSSSQVNVNYLLASGALGLGSTPAVAAGTSTGYTGDVTTGQILGPIPALPGGFGEELNGGVQTIPTGMGGPCYIFAAAGTYTVSVQFKASSGSVTASNRRLYVRAISFG